MNTTSENMKVARFLTGSRAYGYATPESDYDYRELHMAPLWRVASGMYQEKPKENKEEEDTVSFELGHFALLCLKGSPNNVELLFLPEHCTQIDRRLEPLFHLRGEFLNRQYLRALAGYCVGEMKSLENDINVVKKFIHESHRIERAPKRLAHCFRLLNMGIEVRSGSQTLNVQRPEADYLLRVRTAPQEVFGGASVMEGVARGLVEVKALLERFDALPDLPEPPANFKERIATQVFLIRYTFQATECAVEAKLEHFSL